MKDFTLTIWLDDQLESMLDRAIALSGKNRRELPWEELSRQLKLIQFESLRTKIMPFAEARGYLTYEDIFGEVS